MTLLDLDPDQLLTTTRSVRKRLDLERAVPRELVLECLDIALQAPNGSNQQRWDWVIVDDPALCAEVAAVYSGAMDDLKGDADRATKSIDRAATAQQRIGASVEYLRAHMHEVPVLVIPTLAGRYEGADTFLQASSWGSILPAVWNFMLSLRARGLGSAWTTVHLYREREMAELLGIPYKRYTQAGLFPVAWTKGTDFRPAPRKPAEDVVSWNGWRTTTEGDT